MLLKRLKNGITKPALNFNNKIKTTWKIRINSSADEPTINHNSVEDKNDN